MGLSVSCLLGIYIKEFVTSELVWNLCENVSVVSPALGGWLYFPCRLAVTIGLALMGFPAFKAPPNRLCSELK